MKTEFSIRSRIVTSPFHELESLRVGELKYINKLRASSFQLPASSSVLSYHKSMCWEFGSGIFASVK